ncbi:hypothetical protein M885DRAFT_300958 [Pelagophyceae sp. CCMP2097]|nr:hypothetical protein M885DRAFT_300958 [Pelagophyceae sp. CCMP2097]
MDIASSNVHADIDRDGPSREGPDRRFRRRSRKRAWGLCRLRSLSVSGAGPVDGPGDGPVRNGPFYETSTAPETAPATPRSSLATETFSQEPKGPRQSDLVTSSRGRRLREPLSKDLATGPVSHSHRDRATGISSGTLTGPLSREICLGTSSQRRRHLATPCHGTLSQGPCDGPCHRKRLGDLVVGKCLRNLGSLSRSQGPGRGNLCHRDPFRHAGPGACGPLSRGTSSDKGPSVTGPGVAGALVSLGRSHGNRGISDGGKYIHMYDACTGRAAKFACQAGSQMGGVGRMTKYGRCLPYEQYHNKNLTTHLARHVGAPHAKLAVRPLLPGFDADSGRHCTWTRGNPRRRRSPSRIESRGATTRRGFERRASACLWDFVAFFRRFWVGLALLLGLDIAFMLGRRPRHVQRAISRLGQCSRNVDELCRYVPILSWHWILGSALSQNMASWHRPSSTVRQPRYSPIWPGTVLYRPRRSWTPPTAPYGPRRPGDVRAGPRRPSNGPVRFETVGEWSETVLYRRSRVALSGRLLSSIVVYGPRPSEAVLDRLLRPRRSSSALYGRMALVWVPTSPLTRAIGNPPARSPARHGNFRDPLFLKIPGLEEAFRAERGPEETLGTLPALARALTQLHGQSRILARALLRPSRGLLHGYVQSLA